MIRIPPGASAAAAVVLLLLASGTLSAATVRQGVVPERWREALAAFTGDYTGTWDTEMSASELDDISRYDLTADSVMRLAMDADHRLSVSFYLDAAQAAAGEPIDLLGFGCNSGVGPLVSLDRNAAEDGTPVLRAVFDFDWGRCPARVHAVASTKLLMELVDSAETERLAVRLLLLRKVQGDYRVYAKINGQRQPVTVKPRPDDGEGPHRIEYEVCVEDHGEETCVPRTEQTRVIGLPIPFPGATVAWWTAKTPRLSVEKGKLLLYHEAVYTRAR